MSNGSICGASRGRYGNPVPVPDVNVKWLDDNEEPTTVPEKYACEHPKHWNWGKGTRNGQKLYYPINEMFFQKWELTDKELDEAVEDFDMFSLEMPSRIICENCKNKL